MVVVVVSVVAIVVVAGASVGVAAFGSSEKLDDSIHVEPIEIYELRGVTDSKNMRCKRDVGKI